MECPLKFSPDIRFVGRSRLLHRWALTVGWRWAPARVRISAAGPCSGAVASQTPRRPPSRTSRSRPRSGRNICAGIGSSGSHSTIHLPLAKHLKLDS